MSNPTIFNQDVLTFINDDLRLLRRARRVLERLVEHTDDFTDEARLALRAEFTTLIQDWHGHSDDYPFAEGFDGWHGTNRGPVAPPPQAVIRFGFRGTGAQDDPILGEAQTVPRPAAPATVELTWDFSNVPEGGDFFSIDLPSSAAEFDDPSWFAHGGGWVKYRQGETELTATVSLLTDDE